LRDDGDLVCAGTNLADPNTGMSAGYIESNVKDG
jgi:hypothetical protein